MEHDLPNNLESHSPIEIDCPAICASDMQPRVKAVAPMISHQFPDEARSMPFATMCRMGADAADFWIAFHHQAFSAHCDQFAIGANTKVRSHFAGANAKKAGECEGCQVDHLL